MFGVPFSGYTTAKKNEFGKMGLVLRFGSAGEAELGFSIVLQPELSRNSIESF
jgi:hypothetical protein